MNALGYGAIEAPAPQMVFGNIKRGHHPNHNVVQRHRDRRCTRRNGALLRRSFRNARQKNLAPGLRRKQFARRRRYRASPSTTGLAERRLSSQRGFRSKIRSYGVGSRTCSELSDPGNPRHYQSTGRPSHLGDSLRTSRRLSRATGRNKRPIRPSTTAPERKPPAQTSLASAAGC